MLKYKYHTRYDSCNFDVANRGLLSEESDPLLNLKKWLSEKCVKDADKIVELGEPIISVAMKSETTSENHGVFQPVSISVKNYRNYKEESFDFSDISFCSINGVNGAGKSSLFMDAIADCLYEETREGDNKAWIRGTEDARSGSIEFVFDIGDKRFRVVRTRTKSGRAKRKDEIDRRKALKARLEGEKASNDKTIASCTENVSTVKLESNKLTESVLKLTETVERYQEAKRISEELRVYADQKVNIPVYAERKKHIAEKLKDLEERERLKNEEWSKLCAEYIRLNEELAGLPEGKEEKLSDLERKKTELEEKAASMQVRKGVLLQRIEDTKKANEEINQLKAEISRDAEKAARYEVLKQAFSQDGVPHQIVRNIIPHITDTANNILGQMTGGTMGVEFVMERTVKGKDGDKATLDVLISEYGKTTLPYASKSGGEKVKSSLAVILALSKIKATAAGIQLGMLFIDEPPFLDDDGAQAYVDSLETIRSRYPDVKVMAITHDDAMKARFSQSITVIKTDEGSKVIC